MRPLPSFPQLLLRRAVSPSAEPETHTMHNTDRKNDAAATTSGQRPFAAQKTIDVSQAE